MLTVCAAWQEWLQDFDECCPGAATTAAQSLLLKLNHEACCVQASVIRVQSTASSHQTYTVQCISHSGLLPPSDSWTGDSLTEGGGHCTPVIVSCVLTLLSCACFSTGWSAAWLANAYARLLDGDAAFKQVHSLLSNFTGMFFPVHVLLLVVFSPANSVN